ncbi:hypothetical protein U1Q18_005546 [Sarracenia purpurea var. burkii]
MECFGLLVLCKLFQQQLWEIDQGIFRDSLGISKPHTVQDSARYLVNKLPSASLNFEISKKVFTQRYSILSLESVQVQEIQAELVPGTIARRLNPSGDSDVTAWKIGLLIFTFTEDKEMDSASKAIIKPDGGTCKSYLLRRQAHAEC